jgi:hypothetical protein
MTHLVCRCKYRVFSIKKPQNNPIDSINVTENSQQYNLKQ